MMLFIPEPERKWRGKLAVRKGKVGTKVHVHLESRAPFVKNQESIRRAGTTESQRIGFNVSRHLAVTEIFPPRVVRNSPPQFVFPIDLFLENYQDEVREEELATLTRGLLDRCEDARDQRELAEWFVARSRDWVTLRRRALFPALEVAAARRMREAAPAFADVLDDELADPSVATVAAQRVRQLGTLGPEVSARIVAGLKSAVHRWMVAPNEEWRAVVAAPSIAVLASTADVPWIAEHLTSLATESVAWGLAQGILDRSGPDHIPFDRPSRASLFTAAERRLNDTATADYRPLASGRVSRSDLRSSLIRCLGATASEDTLPALGRSIELFFRRGPDPERLAAIGAARLATRLLGAAATRAVFDAFDASELPQAEKDRFWALVINLVPSRAPRAGARA